jgi:hypothetical protein
MFFHHKLPDAVLPGDPPNPNIETVSIHRAGNTELPHSGDSINSEPNGSEGNSSSGFVFEPDLEEVQL